MNIKIKRLGNLFQVVDRNTVLIYDLCGYLTTTPAHRIEEYFRYLGLLSGDINPCIATKPTITGTAATTANTSGSMTKRTSITKTPIDAPNAVASPGLDIPAHYHQPTPDDQLTESSTILITL